MFKATKYSAIKTTVNGVKFDSKAEAEYYLFLKGLCDVEILDLQPKIYLTTAKILYKPDFYVKDLITKESYYIDVKGMCTPVFMIKKRLWKAYRTERLLLVKKSGKTFKVMEDIKSATHHSTDDLP